MCNTKPDCDFSQYELRCSDVNFASILDGSVFEGGDASSFPAPDNSLGCGERFFGAPNAVYYCCPCTP